jgi:hypothetical protein
MRMNRGVEFAAESVNPIARFAEEPIFVTLIASRDGSGVFSHVGSFEGFSVIENSGVVTAMEISVGFDVEMIGKDSATVAEQRSQEIAGLRAVSFPRLKPHAQARRQTEAEHDERGQRQQRQSDGAHSRIS